MILRAPAESFFVVERISPSAGLTSGAPSLGVTPGMFWRPLDRAALTRSFQPDVLMLRLPQIALALMMIPTSGGPPLFANRTAYSPSQSPDQSSW